MPDIRAEALAQRMHDYMVLLQTDRGIIVCDNVLWDQEKEICRNDWRSLAIFCKSILEDE